jgi:hypothetical protein
MGNRMVQEKNDRVNQGEQSPSLRRQEQGMTQNSGMDRWPRTEVPGFSSLDRPYDIPFMDISKYHHSNISYCNNRFINFLSQIHISEGFHSFLILVSIVNYKLKNIIVPY